MQTAKLDEILRQKDPMLKETVEQLARGDVRGGIANLEQQGRVHEIVNPQERFGAIAREYARKPEGTLVISPDNESRRELNSLIHREMMAAATSFRRNRVAGADALTLGSGLDSVWGAHFLRSGAASC
ncbi:MAG: AAA family ATPase [Candidatus Sulfotelmatobacter sp.]